IIIQGDHGGGSLYNQSSYEKSCLEERYSPLLAIYSDYNLNIGYSDGYSLVNIYRDILNAISNEAFPSIKKETYFIPWGSAKDTSRIDISNQGSCTI
ncbi:hypothetical protein AB4587_07290, partial [Vibrio breoganii]